MINKWGLANYVLKNQISHKDLDNYVDIPIYIYELDRME